MAAVTLLSLAAGGLTGLEVTGVASPSEVTASAMTLVMDLVPGQEGSQAQASDSGSVGSLPVTGSTPAGPDVPEPTPTAGGLVALSAEDRMAGLLSRDEPQSADGVLVVVPGSQPGPGSGRVYQVRVEVEAGLPVDAEAFAVLVMGILNNPKGWGAEGDLSFARTDGDDPDLRVVLASPDKVDEMCAPLDTAGRYSCGRHGYAAINYTRWVSGAESFDDMTSYRQYVINHEVGHLLGYPYERCPGPGEVAPVMMRQTTAVNECVPNGWPHPDVG